MVRLPGRRASAREFDPYSERYFTLSEIASLATKMIVYLMKKSEIFLVKQLGHAIRMTRPILDNII